MKNFITELEERELIQKLVNEGHGKLVDAFLLHDKECFTKNGRLNKSGCCRVLKWKTKQLEDALVECRNIVG